MTTTAVSVAPENELVRDARERYATGKAERREALMLTAAGVAAGIVVAAVALAVDAGPSFLAWRFVFFAAAYAAATNVEFEIGTGSAIPTELVLVPMLFSMPLGLVPLAVLVAFVARGAATRPFPLRTPSRVLRQFPTALHAVGPVLVLSLAHGLPLRWSAWPIYVVALLAQFAADFAYTAWHALAAGVPVRDAGRFALLAYSVDAALAPLALALAFAAQSRPLLVLLVFPLIGLLRYFAHERKQRIDHALELSDAYRGTAFLLGDVVEADDAYTGSHSRHVVDLVLGVADKMGLSASDRRDAEFVALLHDVGKIRIPSEIINKPGPLTPDEREIINTHTIEGEKMLTQVGGLIGHVGKLVRSCHERWDGQGYPDGLAGEETPLVARIVCACDAYSAMTTDRSYRKARSRDDALAELERCAGTQFDADVVSAIVAVETSRRA